ncbi:aKG-HExxH-type peptide beta-hydroxylase [Lysinibacillus xylanilyticus]|uniref:aKG-HExxH-type peptide beta-hydroxylase n=1 Tax=Lysinibacillus xylanilyticus TaxID=582475 RepID=UPI003D01E172
MLFLKGEKDVLKTISILSQKYSNGNSSYTELKNAYTNLLDNLQDWVPHSHTLKTNYITDIDTTTKLFKVFNSESLADDVVYEMQKSNNEKAKNAMNTIYNAAENLGSIYPPFHWIYNLVIDTVFNISSESISGGTTSGAIGILFADPRSNYTNEDIYEFLVHELGHTLLFLYELRYGLYTDSKRIPDKNTFALSAMRKQLRPIDKALHSVVVATEVLLLRDKVLGHKHSCVLHPSTDELIPAVNISIESIFEMNRKENILTSYSENILKQCHEFINTLQVRGIQ